MRPFVLLSQSLLSTAVQRQAKFQRICGRGSENSICCSGSTVCYVRTLISHKTTRWYLRRSLWSMIIECCLNRSLLIANTTRERRTVLINPGWTRRRSQRGSGHLAPHGEIQSSIKYVRYVFVILLCKILFCYALSIFGSFSTSVDSCVLILNGQGPGL